VLAAELHIMSESRFEDSVNEGEKPNMSADVTQTKVESHVTEIDGEDGRDPRKWSPRKKLLVFIALMSSSVLADGYVAAGLHNPRFYHMLIDPKQGNDLGCDIDRTSSVGVGDQR
jgi:hypothetical protein